MNDITCLASTGLGAHWQCPPVSMLSPGSSFRGSKQCQWLGLVMDLKGGVGGCWQKADSPGKQSETWPALASGVPKS